jgi:8-oxo-dGTP diphosphatase
VASITRAFRFCPYCAGPLSPARGTARRQICGSCSAELFHAARPCASVILTRQPGPAVLLIRRSIGPYRRWWDIPGGYVEFAEMPEAAAVREAREETGFDVRVVSLLGIWGGTYRRRYGVDRTLNLYYLAEVTGGRERAGDDAGAVGWFMLDNLPARLAWPEHARPALEAAKASVAGSAIAGSA